MTNDSVNERLFVMMMTMTGWQDNNADDDASEVFYM